MAESPTFHESLPRKRMGAGMVFLDDQHRVLLVKPTYKRGWELPGGVVEDHESPRDAAAREVGEELGISVDVGPMICVDYNASADGYLESLMFLFAGPRLTTTDQTSIRLPPQELSEWRWCDITEAASLLDDRVGRRLTACLHTGQPTVGLYLEDQAPVTC